MNNNNSSQYLNLKSLAQMWDLITSQYGDILALHDPHGKPELKLTYSQLYDQIKAFAIALQTIDIQPGEKISLFADNSPRWLICDQGTITAGAVNAVRSSQAEKNELLYILEDSDSVALIAQDLATLEKLSPELAQYPLKAIILLSDEDVSPLESGTPIYNYSQFMALASDKNLLTVDSNIDDLATLIYTSGTTGKPKGVMLSHKNLLHQVRNLECIIQPAKGDRILTILPSWHSYERASEYFLLSRGVTIIYTSIRYFKEDLKEHKPHYMVGVPRLWQSIYEGVQKNFRDSGKQKLVNFFLGASQKYLDGQRNQKGLTLDNLNPSTTDKILGTIQVILYSPLHWIGDKLVYKKVRQGVGGSIKAWVSGGGSLARHIDNFFQIVGIPLLVGYGLTETSPVTNARRITRNIVGASGQPLPETEIMIVHPETKEPLPQGETGLVFIRGTQLMQGYYKKPEATAKAINEDGWFDSGDLGMVTPMNDLVITGRAKDTIVLSNGENIEPQPIEDVCLRSLYIDQIMLVGQDQKYLGALIVPNLDALQIWAKENNVTLNIPDNTASREEIQNSSLYAKEVLKLFKQELNREVKNRPGYRADDRIAVFELLLEPFSMANGMMTQTLKLKRPVVTNHYQDMINGMF